MTAPASLAEALAQLQGKLPHVGKETPGQVGSQKYKYADLTDVSGPLLPVMAALGLSFSARPLLTSEGKFVLSWILRHVSGQSDSGEYPIGGGSPQAIGSAITYARRYTLCAVTGLAPGGDENDYAETEYRRQAGTDLARAGAEARGLRRPADARTKERAKTQREHAARAGNGAPVDRGTGEVLAPADLTDPEDKPGSIAAGQSRAIEAQLGMLGYDSKDRDGRHAEAAALLGLDELPPDPNHPEGDPRPSMNGLSMTQAAALIKSLQDSLDAKRENERLANA